MISICTKIFISPFIAVYCFICRLENAFDAVLVVACEIYMFNRCQRKSGEEKIEMISILQFSMTFEGE